MRDALFFFGQMATNWRETGAIAPSGPVLAKAMAEAIGPIEPGQVIIELGPGTGIFTEALCRRHPRARVVAIEFNSKFVPRLRQRLPHATIVDGCASKIDEHLGRLGIAHDQVAAVVSGLPLLVMPKDLTGRILAAVELVLAPGRRFVQFTYSAKAWSRFDPRGFAAQPSRRVWLNVPPAVILPFVRAAA